MLLSITTTHRPATDLGYLLHKNPVRVQQFDIPSGTAHVCYPRADEESCTALLLLEIDPIALVRRGRAAPSGEAFSLGHYVNDRPYAASSLLAVALRAVFSTALSGRSRERPELAVSPIPLELRVAALPCLGGAQLARELFAPLGWEVDAVQQPVDPEFAGWGYSPYLDVRLAGTARLSDALQQLYVLLPVLDDAKHYWVGPDEVDKLIRAGGTWLQSHPYKDLITTRYLAHQKPFTRMALARLADVDDAEPEDIDNATDGTTGTLDEPAAPPLAAQRRGAVLSALRSTGARRVGDFGCGEGTLVADLLADRNIEHVLAMDVSARALDIAARRLHLDRMSARQRERLHIFQSSLTYRDDRLGGLDAAVLMEVIEHVDPSRLGALEQVVFRYAAPTTVIVTTPNAEHNVRYPSLPVGSMRHRDHRFEWSRHEFGQWARRVSAEQGYNVRFVPVGSDEPEVGPPTQLGVFTKVAR